MDRRTRILMIAVGAVVVVALVVWGVMATGGTAIGQSLTIGYVDMQRALDSHPRKAASEEALNQFARAKSAEAQRAAQGKSPAEQAAIARRTQEEVLKRRTELLQGLDKDIRAAVEKVARSAGVMIVLDRTVVLYGGTDLTEQVIKELRGN